MAKKSLKNGKGDITQNTYGYVGSPEAAITRIIEQTKWRFRQDIDSWRGAIQTAENIIYPARIYLYTLYDELILDAHITAIIGQRLNKLLSQEFRLIKGDKDDAKAKAIFESQWFYEFMSIAMSSNWWGHALIQLWNPDVTKGTLQVLEVPRRHVIPEWGGISTMQGDYMNYTNYRQSPYIDWLVECMPQGPRWHGLFKVAAPNFIFKKNAMLNWSQYTEIFGMPVRVGKTSSRKQADVDRMARNLKEMGAAAYGVFQDGESIEFIESTKGDAFNVYDKLIDRQNSELSKLFLHQVMTTDNGSSLSQAEVHERILDAVGDGDKRFMKYLINDQLIPRLIGFGFDLTGVRFDWASDVDTDTLWTKTKDAMQYFDVDEAWIKQTFGIPVTKKEVTAPTTAEPDDDDKPSKDVKPDKGVKKKSLSLSSRLQLIDKAYSCKCGKCGGYHPGIKLSVKPVSIDKDDFLKWVFDNPDANLPHEDTLANIANNLWNAYSKPFKKGFDNVELANAAKENLWRFATAKTLTMQAALNEVRADGDTLADFKDAAKPVTDKFNAYQQTEVGTTLTRAQIARQWQDIQENVHINPNLTWKGIGDSRERLSHLKLNNLTLPATDPLWKRYTPGMDYNCRCEWAQEGPDVDVTDHADAKKLFEAAAPPPELQGNPGIDGTVFGNQHSYFKGNLKKVNGLDMEDYGFKPVE